MGMYNKVLRDNPDSILAQTHLSVVLNAMGRVCEKTGGKENVEVAMNYYERGLRIRRSHRRSDHEPHDVLRDLVVSLNNCSRVAKTLKRIDSARVYSQECLSTIDRMEDLNYQLDSSMQLIREAQLREHLGNREVPPKGDPFRTA